MKIINVYRGFTVFGGAETVLLNLHESFKELGFECYVSGPNSFAENHPKYSIPEKEYIELSLKNIYEFRNAIIFSHHRKPTTFLYWSSYLPGLDIRLINVVHSEFFDLPNVTFLPKENVAVSERVKSNLISEFKVKPGNVRVIYNGLPDENPDFNIKKNSENQRTSDKIKILYPGRITSVKRQVEVVQQLKDKLNPHIQIDFAGVGEEYDLLQGKTSSTINFKTLGFVSLKETLPNYDYVMLFSTNEGLPLTLIEGCMFGKPIICNDVGGNWEILEDQYNGFAANSFDELVQVLNTLPKSTDPVYQEMSGNSRKTFEEKFQKQRMIKEYVEIISETK